MAEVLNNGSTQSKDLAI